MLVLSRRANEKLVFPQSDVTLHVLSVKGNVVRLGVEAPPEVKVFREELVPAQARPVPAAVVGGSPARDLRDKIGFLTRQLQEHAAAGRTAKAAETLKKLSEAVDSLDCEGAKANPGRPAAAKPPRPKCQPLVVEDDADQRELLARLLDAYGCDCNTAEDGEAALDYLASHERPDFVLLDMWMPRCDGPETVARIRHDPRFAGLKIFAVSGTPPRELGVHTGPDGIDGWFPKPVNPQTLWESIQRHLKAASVHN